MSHKFNKESFDKKWRLSPSGCWEWLAVKNQDGYGRVKRLGRLESAHRVSYELYKGPFDLTKHICHSCDNPGCVNPDHLWLGDYEANTKDKVIKARQYKKLTEEQVLIIRDSQETNASLAKKYKISQASVSLIKRRINWKHL